MTDQGLMRTDFKGLKLLNTGKVRDIYDLGEHLLIVATDRISAFDVVMAQPVPKKGEILTLMSAFWFRKTEDIIENHFVTMDAAQYPAACAPYRKILRNRTMLVKKAVPLPVECVVRGYLSGSGWKDYRHDGTVSGMKLAPEIRESEKLSEPLFTPTTKAPQGMHDLPISKAEMENVVGAELTERIIESSLAIYERASAIADAAGIIIADTKMEFGLCDGRLILIDELLTPDSSRFWPKDAYRVGASQMSFDKQFLRDYLLSITWNQKPPPPDIPANIIRKTAKKYREALQRIVGSASTQP